jgi:pyruvate kinase
MVTLPREAATDPAVVRKLVAAGANCVRINAAHDDAATWRSMIRNVRAAAAEMGTECRILVDLAGPKLRTGPIVPGARVVKLRPRRDERGRVLEPARARLGVGGIPVDAFFLAALERGTRIRLRDARGKKRRLFVVERGGGWVDVESERPCYIETGTLLRAHGVTAAVGSLPAVPRALFVKPGDRFELRASLDAVEPTAGAIGCTLGDALKDVKRGERIFFDEGRIAAVVERASPHGLEVLVTRAATKGARLAAEKGINLPDSRLAIPALSDDDREALVAIAREVDMVGLSFVRTPADVTELRDALRALGRPDLPIVLKIETDAAFRDLPRLLVEVLGHPLAGVMIARGDLAIECGYERLAELQEEILWIAEAAHLPVIWATQVLERLAKDGMPSRAEITDAAMSERAECVMLNKGPHLELAVRCLDDILRRMEEHQTKKVSRLRPLRLALAFGS